MRKALLALLVTAVLLGGGVMAVDAQTFYQKFENIWAKSVTTSGDVIVGDDLTVTDDLTIAGDIATTGGQSMATLTTSGAATIGGAATVSGTTNLVGNATAAGTFAVNGASLSVAKMLLTARQDAIAVTDGGVITPTGTLQELTAAATAGAEMGAAVTAGKLVVLFNSSANTITITDTTGLAAAGNIVLGQNDSATLVSTTAGQWVEVARSNN